MKTFEIKHLKINVSDDDINFAKNQIKAFEKIQAGSWRYKDVEAWRGIVCEMLTSKHLGEIYPVDIYAKGLDDSGRIDDYDMKINNIKVEIKSATKNYFKYLMPKIHDVINHPKDIYIGARYNDNINPNQVQIIGYIDRKSILKYPIKQNKGAPYYEIPLNDLLPLTSTTFVNCID